MPTRGRGRRVSLLLFGATPAAGVLTAEPVQTTLSNGASDGRSPRELLKGIPPQRERGQISQGHGEDSLGGTGIVGGVENNSQPPQLRPLWQVVRHSTLPTMAALG